LSIPPPPAATGGGWCASTTVQGMAADWVKILDVCPLMRGGTRRGVCAGCGKPLKGRQRRWCGKLCEGEFTRQHDWGTAREVAKRRDGNRCVRCGRGPADLDAELEKAIRAATGGRDVSDHERLAFKRAVWAKQLRLDLSLEVNHIEPRRGAGYGFGCWNHQDNLITLCHKCHLQSTAQQRATGGIAPLDLQDADRLARRR
jgi:5-methylcytosine-specific restriction endonuclease McrA